jgi:hypothetical protein
MRQQHEMPLARRLYKINTGDGKPRLFFLFHYLSEINLKGV